MDYFSLDLLPSYSPGSDTRTPLLFDDQGPMMCANNSSKNITLSQELTEDDIAIKNVDLLGLLPLDGSAQKEEGVGATWDWDSILNEVGLNVPQLQDTDSADILPPQLFVELPPAAPTFKAPPEPPPPAEALPEVPPASEGHRPIPPGICDLPPGGGAVVQEPNLISTQLNEAKAGDALLLPANFEVVGDDSIIYAWTCPPTPTTIALPQLPSPVPQPQSSTPAVSATPVSNTHARSITQKDPSSGGKERCRNSRKREKKIPKYLQPPCEDEEEEKKRQNAYKARTNRERKKEELRLLKEKLNETNADRDRLRTELTLLRADNDGMKARLNAIQKALKLKE